jgi:simple sugar transport system permease protein
MLERWSTILWGGMRSWIIMVLSVVLILAALLWLADAGFAQSLAAFLKGAFGGRNFAYLMVTGSRAALITGMAISALIAFRAGQFNIGGEGQLVIGGLASAVAGLYLGIGGALGIFLAICAGAAAAAAWAVLAGVMRVWLGVPILVGTLLLNYPARFISSYFVSHPLRDVDSGLHQTHLLDQSVWLPLIPGTRLDSGFLIIIFVFIAMLFYCHRTVAGYEAKMTGMSPDFAAASGLNIRKIDLTTLALSGAVAGLVGGIAVLGIQHRFTDHMLVQPLYAWTGIVAALMVNLVPWAVLPAGFFFAAIHSGAAGMERTAGVPREIAVIAQGIIILLVASRSSGTFKTSLKKEE